MTIGQDIAVRAEEEEENNVGCREEGETVELRADEVVVERGASDLEEVELRLLCSNDVPRRALNTRSSGLGSSKAKPLTGTMPAADGNNEVWLSV